LLTRVPRGEHRRQPGVDGHQDQAEEPDVNRRPAWEYRDADGHQVDGVVSL